jgi:HAD superfamily hydrolase (TIGR01450 family)
MRAIILAEDDGVGLRPITAGKPKPLVKVNGTPILGHQLEALRANGIGKVTVVSGAGAEQVEAYCDQHHRGIDATIVSNAAGEESGRLSSLFLAREQLVGDTLLMDVGAVVEAGLIGAVAAADGAVYAVGVGSAQDAFAGVCKLDGQNAACLRRLLGHAASRKASPSGGALELLRDLFAEAGIEATPFPTRGHRCSTVESLDDLIKADMLFSEALRKLRSKRLFILDKDGTLILGSKRLPSAEGFLSALREHKKHYLLFTNNSSHTIDAYVEQFKALGLPMGADNIVVTSDVLMSSLLKKKVRRIYLVATEAVSRSFEERGFVLSADDPEAVVLTYDTELTYEKLVRASILLRTGIPYYVTHIDQVCPSLQGPLPDIGTTISTLETATGRLPDEQFGKPSLRGLDEPLERLGLTREDCVMVGDRLYTDIRLGVEHGITSVLVLSGETLRPDVEDSEWQPDIIAPDVGALVPFLAPPH